MVFGLKRPSMSVHNLFFARPLPKLALPLLFSIIGIRKRRQDVLPASLLQYFTLLAFYLLLKVKSELASLLVDPGHLQEERIGGRPHYRYRRARRHRPVEDRALQKNTNITDDHGQILPETFVSLL